MRLILKSKSDEKSKSKSKIDRTLLYFIAFLYSISTGEIGVIDLFNVARHTKYGRYTRLMNEAYNLGIEWKYGMVRACEIISNRLRKSDVLTSQLMMKLAQVLRLGDNLAFFLKNEFNITMKLYYAEYERSIESMKMLMSIYSAIASTTIFMIAASMLMTMISGVEGSSVIVLTTISIIFGLGIFVYMMYKIFPRDILVNESGNITSKYKKLFYIAISASIGIASLILTDILEPLLIIAIAGIPLVLIGLYARRIEKRVLSMNTWYPPFIRQFGEIYSTVGSMGNALDSTLKSEFGPLKKPLNIMLNRVLNRVKVEEAFDALSKDSGNTLITAGSMIASISIIKGAKMSIVGSIISEVTIMLNELYNKRIQIAKVFESTLLIMHILSLSVLSFMSSLVLLFSKMFKENTEDVIRLGLIDPTLIDNILPFIVIALSFINGFATQVGKGSLYKCAWFNIGLFMSIGSISVYASEIFIKELMEGLLELNI